MPRRKPTRQSRRKRTSKIVPLIKKVLSSQIEKKHVFSSFDSTSVQDSGRTPLNFLLNAMAQGDGQGQRTGHQIRVTGIHFKFWFHLDAIATSDYTNFVRVQLIKPHDPAVTTISNAWYTHIDEDSSTIIMDKSIALNAYGPSTATMTYGKKFRGSGMVTQFSGAAAADLSRNRLILNLVSDSSVVPDPKVSGYYYLYYTDA